jgi:hypothetical protein
MTNCRVPVLFAIRDNAKRLGLTADEVALLFTVESHGTATAKVETLLGETGLTRATFYRARARLISVGLLVAVERGRNQTTHYRVIADALVSQGKTAVSQGGTAVSQGETPVSHHEHQEEDPKKTRKKTMKKSADFLSFSEPEEASPEGIHLPAEGGVTSLSGIFGTGSSLDELVADHSRTAEAATRRTAEQAERIRARDEYAVRLAGEHGRIRERGLSEDQTASFLEGIAL